MLNNNFTLEEFGLSQIPIFVGFIVGAQMLRFLSSRIELNSLVNLGMFIGFSGALLILVITLIGEDFPIKLFAV